MKLNSTGIIDGYLLPIYGKYSDNSFKIDNVPIVSPPLEWSLVPEKTKSLALIMQDFDAVAVCGFSWIHWLVANINPNLIGLPQNASRDMQNLLQGKNSLASKQICGDMSKNVINYYSGPKPPDKDHEYQFELYALDVELDLKSGFGMNDLQKAMRGHILEQAIFIGIYKV